MKPIRLSRQPWVVLDFVYILYVSKYSCSLLFHYSWSTFYCNFAYSPFTRVSHSLDTRRQYSLVTILNCNKTKASTLSVIPQGIGIIVSKVQSVDSQGITIKKRSVKSFLTFCIRLSCRTFCDYFVFVPLITASVSRKAILLKLVNQTSLVAVVPPNCSRTKLVRNRCVIDRFGGVFCVVAMLCMTVLLVYGAFVIWIGRISYFSL